MKYAWIKEHRDSFPVAIMCDVLTRISHLTPDVLA